MEAGPPTLWRYAGFLPVAPPVGGLPVGRSPLIRADRLAAELGLECTLFIKTETSNPTHSLRTGSSRWPPPKPSSSATRRSPARPRATWRGAGPRPPALGLPAYIFVPADLEQREDRGRGSHGATVFAVDGSYDDVNRLCSELAYERPWAFVNVNMRAYYSEGSKTIALETAEDLGWRAPDRVVAPIASGSLYTKILQGFREGRGGGARGARPRSDHARRPGRGCAPVATAFAAEADRVVPVRPRGLAKSLAIGNPADGVFALGVARSTGGSDRVGRRRRACRRHPAHRTDDRDLHRDGGRRHGGRPAAAGGAGRDRPGPVVAYITGDGLKTIDAVVPAVTTIDVPADVDAVDAALAPAALT